MKAPTTQQADKLRILASGAVAIAPGRRDWTPLLRRGWVERIGDDDTTKRYLPPLRITADGLRALADALDRDGQPEWPPAQQVPQQLDESPLVTDLRARLAAAQAERDEQRARANKRDRLLMRAKRTLEGVEWP